jgi:hypothetical protein
VLCVKGRVDILAIVVRVDTNILIPAITVAMQVEFLALTVSTNKTWPNDLPKNKLRNKLYNHDHKEE